MTREDYLQKLEIKVVEDELERYNYVVRDGYGNFFKVTRGMFGIFELTMSDADGKPHENVVTRELEPQEFLAMWGREYLPPDVAV